MAERVNSFRRDNMSDISEDDVRAVLNAVQYSDRYALAQDDYHGLVRVGSPADDYVVSDIHEKL